VNGNRTGRYKVKSGKSVVGLWSILILIAGLVLSGQALAETAKEYEVVSQYRNVIDGSVSNRISWRFVRSTGEDQDSMIMVDDTEKRVGARAELFLEDGRVTKIANFRSVRGEEIVEMTEGSPSKPLLVDRCLAPVDWLNCPLPFDPEPIVDRFSISKTIGGARFGSVFTVRAQEVPEAEAVAKGWLTDDNHRFVIKGERLYLVQIDRLLSGKSEPVLKQLWSRGGEFWLYEEKGRRSSWRCR